MVEMGQAGRLYLLNRDRLGGRGQGPGGKDDVLQNLGPFEGVWGHPAVYGGEGGYVYFVQNSSSMLAFRYGTTGQGRPALARAGNTAEDFGYTAGSAIVPSGCNPARAGNPAEDFGYTAGSPIVTSDGTRPGSAVVWVVNVDGPDGGNGRLCAY